MGFGSYGQGSTTTTDPMTSRMNTMRRASVKGASHSSAVAAPAARNSIDPPSLAEVSAAKAAAPPAMHITGQPLN